MDDFDFISRIPDELKVLIFRHVDSFTIITLEKISRNFTHLTFDKSLLRKLCFQLDYRFKYRHLQTSLLHKLRKEIITSLNINCIYWIPRSKIKKCLSLQMLKSLYALDTKLELEDVCSSNLVNLQTLAITVNNTGPRGRLNVNVLKNLKKLCLHCGTVEFLCYIFSVCPELEELWFFDVPENSLVTSVDSVPHIPKTIKRLVIQRNSTIFVPYALFGPSKSHTITFRRSSNVCFEISNKAMCNTYTDSFYETIDTVLWKRYLYDMQCDYPFGVHDMKKLVYKWEKFDHINFQELSLSHLELHCCAELRSIEVSILALPSTRFLRKLSINRCILELGNVKTPNTDEPLFKHRRISTVQVAESILNAIVEHSPLIEELEILQCRKEKITTTGALSYIGKLTNLKRLVLYHVSHIGDGKYLLDICRGCPNLTSLKIWSHNSSLNGYLCMSIPYLNMLKDLRYEQTELPLNRLMECLVSNPDCKLERVVLICRNIALFTFEPLKRFLNQNPQLILLYIVIRELSDTAIKHVSRDLKRIQQEHQIFIVSKKLVHYSLPHVHMFEMVEYHSSVSVIDSFTGFQ